MMKGKEWSIMTEEERIKFLRDFANFTNDVFVRHENPFIQERIDDAVPFEVRVLEGSLVIFPDYGGPSVMDRERMHKLQAELLPFVLPSDTIIDYEVRETDQNVMVDP